MILQLRGNKFCSLDPENRRKGGRAPFLLKTTHVGFLETRAMERNTSLAIISMRGSEMSPSMGGNRVYGGNPSGEEACVSR